MIRREPDGTERRVTLFVSDVDLTSAELIGLNIGGFHKRHPMFHPEVGGAYSIELDDDEIVDLGDANALLATDEAVYPESRVALIVERWTRGAHIVGAVPNFDTECLAPLLRRHQLCPAWHYHLIDVEALMVGYLDGGGRTDAMPSEVREALTLPWRSDDLSRIIGVEPPTEEQRHTAMGDADWAMRIYDRITGGAA